MKRSSRKRKAEPVWRRKNLHARRVQGASFLLINFNCLFITGFTYYRLHLHITLNLNSLNAVKPASSTRTSRRDSSAITHIHPRRRGGRMCWLVADVLVGWHCKLGCRAGRPPLK
jgi:hypothetical protein